MGDSLCCLTNFQYLRSWYGLYQAFFPVRESMVCYDSVLNGSPVDSVSLTLTTLASREYGGYTAVEPTA